MDAPLADTNILSELARKEPDPAVLRWAAEVATVAVSAITVDEIPIRKVKAVQGVGDFEFDRDRPPRPARAARGRPARARGHGRSGGGADAGRLNGGRRSRTHPPPPAPRSRAAR